MAVFVAKLKTAKNHVDFAFGHASLVVKCTTLGICVLYLLCLVPSIYGVVAVTPGYLIPPNFRIWTLATAGLAETSIIGVIIDVGVLILCARQLEPLWGALEFLKFLVIVDVGSCTGTAFTHLFLYLSTKFVNIWFTPFSGMAGIIGGIAVAFKQIMPDQKIDTFVVIRVQYIPSLLVILYTALAFLRIISPSHPLLMAFGIMTGWVYLRFYQPRGKGIRGDLSDSFEFASFFPPSLGAPVRLISNVVFGTLVRFGVCKNPVRTYDVGAPSAITITLPGANSVDQERRRKKALRAVNERLKKSQTGKKDEAQVDSWPSIEDALDPPENLDVSSEEKIEDAEVPEVVHLDGTAEVRVEEPTLS